MHLRRVAVTYVEAFVQCLETVTMNVRAGMTRIFDSFQRTIEHFLANTM